MPVPDFSLLDQDRRPFHLSSVRGKVVLVTFIYTTCPDICPLLTAKFADIQRKFKSEGRNDHFLLSITTDPEVDTPKVLKSYGQRFEADFHSWAFLTGDKKDLSEVWRSFGVYVRKRGKGLIEHTGLTTLIDRQGIRRIDYYGDSWTEKEVLKDIASLAKEGQTVSSAKSENHSFDLKIERRKVVGGVKTVRVKQGEQVWLRWTTDEAVTVHLHGYDIEKILKPGETAVMSFKAHATGRVTIESHGFGGKKCKHVILLYLEVLPR
jgi:protein SCO1/2